MADDDDEHDALGGLAGVATGIKDGADAVGDLAKQLDQPDPDIASVTGDETAGPAPSPSGRGEGVAAVTSQISRAAGAAGDVVGGIGHLNEVGGAADAGIASSEALEGWGGIQQAGASDLGAIGDLTNNADIQRAAGYMRTAGQITSAVGSVVRGLRDIEHSISEAN